MTIDTDDVHVFLQCPAMLFAAIATRPDVIIATGRSDFPNQVNNVIAFPPLFRGALDCRAK
jgi:malic enzyme